MRLAFALFGMVAACAEPAYELSFDRPDDIPAGFDMSCATAVGVYAVGEDRGTFETPPDVEYTCIDLPRGPSSFADVESMIRGKIDLPLPASGLAAVGIAGFMGRCDDPVPYHETVYYGGAPFTGGDALRIPFHTNVSCASQTQYTVRSIDLIALAETGQCQSPPGQIFPATIRPYLLGDGFPLMMFEFGNDGAESTTGVATVKSFTSAGPQSCIALGAAGMSTVAFGGGGCLNTTAPKLCGTEHEVAVTPLSFSGKSRDDALLAEYGEPVIGVVLSTAKAPIAGATISVAGDASAAKVIYATPDGTRTQLVDTNGSATNASGFFLIYLKGMPTQITVSAPGHRAQTYTVASSLDWPSTLAVALAPQ